MFFDDNEVTIKKIEKMNSYAENLLIHLDQYPNKLINIVGHSDISESNNSNVLCYNRANNIKKILINYGINEDKITIITKGSDAPFASSSTEYGRSKNRRVEIRVF